MHIDIVPNRNSRPTFLLRESYREGSRVRKRTLANLSTLNAEQIEAIRAVLRGETLRPIGELFEAIRSLPHGHVQAVSVAMQRLEFGNLLSTRVQPERDLVCAMVAARILEPHTKLATTRWWHTTTLADDFGVAEASEDALYAAMDWLLQRQDTIQKKLAARHLSEGSLVLYDLSSSYFEGTTCPLAKRGYSRDGKRGTLQVNYGLLTDGRGCPVAVSVHEGNTADSLTFMPEVRRLRQDFRLERLDQEPHYGRRHREQHLLHLENLHSTRHKFCHDVRGEGRARLAHLSPARMERLRNPGSPVPYYANAPYGLHDTFERAGGIAAHEQLLQAVGFSHVEPVWEADDAQA